MTLEAIPPASHDAPAFLWSRHYDGGTCVVALSGELDIFGAGRLADMLLAVADTAGAARIVVDMSEVRYIDAFSIGVLVDAWAAARLQGRTLELAGLRGTPAKVFELVGLGTLGTSSPAWAGRGGMIDVRGRSTVLRVVEG